MHDYVKLINDIQVMLASDLDPVEVELKRLEKQYSEAIRHTNERLRFCEKLIRDGHRSEAFQYVEEGSNLMEDVAVLDCPEIPVWIDFLRQYGMPVPPELLIDAAADINQAYNDAEQLHDLMKRHRLYALAQSPLRKRISVMRKIAKIDASNPVWLEDLREFEKVRFNQMLGEVQTAKEEGNLQTISKLEEEVRSDAWIDSPPKDVVNRVIGAHTQMRQQSAHRELDKIAHELNDAYAELDIELGRTLRDRWNAKLLIGVEDGEDRLLEIAAPALTWLEKEDQSEQEVNAHREAVSKLEHALDSPTPREELERLYHVAKKFEFGIPKPIQQRLAERLRTIELEKSRKSRNFLVVAVVAMLIVSGIVGALMWNRHNARIIAGHVTTLQARIDSAKETGDLESAETYQDKLKAELDWVYNHPDIQKLIGDLELVVADETRRRDQFAEQISIATKAGTESPTWEGIAKAGQALRNAKPLSKTELDRTEIARLDGQIQQNEAKLQNQADSDFQEAFAAFQSQVKSVDQSDSQRVSELIAEGKRLPQKFPRTTRHLLTQIEPLINALEKMKQLERQKAEKALALAGITTDVGNERAFQNSLISYVKQFPGTKRSFEFKQVADKEIDGIIAQKRWLRFIDLFEARNLSLLSTAEVNELINQATQLQSQLPGFPAQKANRGHSPITPDA